MIRFLPFIAMVFLIACGGETEPTPSETPPSTNDTVDSHTSEDEAEASAVVQFDDIVITGRMMGGDLNNELWSGAITKFKVHDYTNITDFEMIMENDQGAAMIYVTFARNLEDFLVPGQRYELTGSDSAFAAFAQSCSGAEAYSWSYDVSDTSIILETEEQGGSTLVSVDVISSYPDANINDVMSGQFTIERLE